MKGMKNIYRVLWYVSVAACILCVGCTSDPDIFHTEPAKGSGVKFNVVFEPLAPTSMTTRATDAPHGEALNGIEDLCVLLFDKDKLLLARNGIRELRHDDLTFVDQPQYETDRQATFTLEDVPYGEYYIFAVANLGKRTKTKTFAEISSTREVLEKLRGEGKLSTVADLKAIRLTWDPEAIGNNAEMLGYFTAGKAPGTPAALDGDTPSVNIDREGITLHSWLRRAASKVTIEFDPSQLRNNVRIYLKSARLKHIPLHCPLGDRNAPSSDGELVPDETTPYYHIDYYPEKTDDGAPLDVTDHKNWMVLSRGDILNGVTDLPVEVYDGMHTPQAKALYFYENLQGDGKDKSQDSDLDGELDYPGKNTDPTDAGYMDQKPYGTYVEIEAHYRSNALGNFTQGKIFYRFMLGKDVFKNYDAERNHHYKLTLKFRGNANDVDWHIDYTPESDILYTPDPYYISYLYNQTMDLPLYVSGNIKDGDKINLEITQNGWGPNDPAAFASMYGDINLQGRAADSACNGFLSFQPGNPNGILTPPAGVDDSRKTDYNYTHWYNDGLGKKEILADELRETIKRDGVVNIPLYTREKQLVKTTAFTGNNPYPQYRREATVKLTGTISGQEVGPKYIKILQMRRIINPSGVFRKSKNTEAFKITMAYRTSPTGGLFFPLHSIGPWRAQINVGEGWEIENAENGVISGDDGSEITLSVKPVEAIGDDETRCAYVDIAYNNYTCHHRVILRQGDAPLALLDGQSEWYYYNMRTQNDPVEEPMDEGSLFRYCDVEYPISSENQTDESVGQNAVSLKIEGKDKPLPWTDIKVTYDSAGYSKTDFLNGEARVADFNDFGILYTHDDIGFKLGIIYGDSAVETEFDKSDALSYNKYNNPKKTNGMRGIFIYNIKDARSIFLPIGGTGFGRRKDNGPNEESNRGVLRYAQRSDHSGCQWSGDDLAGYAPIFRRIHEFEGAIYWLKEEWLIPEGFTDADGKTTTNAWDINFRTFDFNHFAGNGAASNHIDAGFIRCVKKKPATPEKSSVRSNAKGSKRILGNTPSGSARP